MQIPQKKRKIWPVVLACVLTLLLTVCILVACWMNSLKLEIQLNGDPEITLQYGQVYAEQGAIATLHSDFIWEFSYDVPVQIDEIGDFLSPGKYLITYGAKIMWLQTSAQRVVTVVDGDAPVITLVPDPPGKFTLPGQPYEEAGFTANDNYDGDITHTIPF